jgi:hypothetical protein
MKNMAHPRSPAHRGLRQDLVHPAHIVFGLSCAPGCADVLAELLQQALLAGLCLHVVLLLADEIDADGWG